VQTIGTKCYGGGEGELTGEAGPWIVIYLAFLFGFYLMLLCALYH